GHHVRMAQPGHRLGLPLEAAARLRALGDERVHHLDRDLPPERGILGAIDRRHPALPQLLHQPIPPERRAGELRAADAHPRVAPASATLCARSAALRAPSESTSVTSAASSRGRSVSSAADCTASASALAPPAGAMTAKSSPPRCTRRAPACPATA